MTSDLAKIHSYVSDELPRIVQIIGSSRIRELDLEQDGCTLSIRRAEAPFEGGRALLGLEAGKSEGWDIEGWDVESADGSPVRVITAPLVGTFYHSEQPERPPLVNEGDRVESGTLLGVIEALQVKTEVEADAAGTIVRILAADGQAVEYGQPLVEVAVER